MRERAGRKITENCPTVPIHYLHRLANFTGPRWGRHSCAAALCTRVTHTHERSRVFICKYSTRRHERTNLRFHRISSLIDSYIRRAGLHARTNRVVLKFNEMVASWPKCFCFLFTYRGRPEFFLYGGNFKEKFSLSLYRTDGSGFGISSRDQTERRFEDSIFFLFHVSRRTSIVSDRILTSQHEQLCAYNIELNRESKI